MTSLILINADWLVNALPGIEGIAGKKQTVYNIIFTKNVQVSASISRCSFQQGFYFLYGLGRLMCHYYSMYVDDMVPKSHESVSV